MIQLTLCGTLCNDFSLTAMFGRRSGRKRKKKLISIIDELSNILTNSKQQYIHHHILNKIVQITGSEYGILSKPLQETDSHFIKYASTNVITNDVETRCIQDNDIYEDVFELKIPYIDNRNSNRYPTIKRMIVYPIIIHNQVQAVLILCNKYSSYTKQDIHCIQQIIHTFIYVFINRCFTTNTEKSI